ncbi:hypothetical protein TNCV_4883991 [Trichonephila clavipes]|nr:hypothetical protein TNCV_4883991 [Trichonephila clavipes]
MSRSPPDRMLFRRTTSDGSTVAISGPVRQNHICSLRSCTLSSYSQSCIFLPADSSYRSVSLAANSTRDGEFCIFCKIFAENPARFIHRHDTAIQSGFLVLLLQEGISGPPFLCYSESSPTDLV